MLNSYNDVSHGIPAYENIIWIIRKLYIFILFWSYVLFFLKIMTFIII